MLFLEDSLSLLFNYILVALDDGACNGADVFHFADVLRLGGIVTIFVKPVLRHISLFAISVSIELSYLNGLELSGEPALLVIVSVFGVNTMDLVPELVDEGFKLILLSLGVGY